ncbi:uncharacterized protein LOC123533679 isoform X1 [Mercenaria mercenaria]|uniref:uncharacterized protein LOC123533679 isoform X1 n=1 Tax=Mercenaria mercenaria TaxID=6596 RepID=UPI00234F772B|nr:uncharacterized protein LOC123533679 isoform X1 [Mercenaria mercenaria]
MLHAVYDVLIASMLVVLHIKADCDSPPNIANADNNITGTPPYSENTTVRYDCNLGYNPTGTSRFYTCYGNTWTDGKFRCEQIFCSYVKPPENGYVVNKPTNEVGTSIKFACNVGHDISGADLMRCRTDGKWSPSAPPTCIPKDCGEFGSIQYADTFQDTTEIERNHYGSVTEVTCRNGRVLNGPPRIRCEADGQWSDRPTCEFLDCPQYPNTNASCVKHSVLSGEFYFLICKEEISTKTGPSAAECISGAWDSLEMACFCDCVIPNYDTNVIITNLNSFDNLPHDTTLEWTCTGGSSKSSVERIICIDGILKAEKDGKEITAANYSNPSDINRSLMHELCILQTTVTSSNVTTSKPSSIPSTPSETPSSDVLTANFSSVATSMPLPVSSISLSMGLSPSISIVSTSVLSKVTVPTPTTISSISSRTNSVTNASSINSGTKVQDISPTKVLSVTTSPILTSVSPISLRMDSSSEDSALLSSNLEREIGETIPTNVLYPTGIPIPISVSSISSSLDIPIVSVTKSQETIQAAVLSLTRTSIPTSVSSISSRMNSVTNAQSINSETKIKDIFPTKVLSVTTSPILTSCAPISSRMVSWSDDSADLSSDLERKREETMPTKLLSQTGMPVPISVSSISSMVDSSLDISPVSVTNSVTKCQETLPSTVLPLTRLPIPSSVSSASSRMNSSSSDISTSSSVSTTINVQATLQTQVLPKTTLSITTSMSPTPSRMDSSSDYSPVSTTNSVSEIKGTLPTIVPSSTQIPIRISVSYIFPIMESSLDISAASVLESVTESQDSKQTKDLTLTRSSIPISSISFTSSLIESSSEFSTLSFSNVLIKDQSAIFIPATVSSTSSRMDSSSDLSSAPSANMVTKSNILSSDKSSTMTIETKNIEISSGAVGLNTYLLVYIFFLCYMLQQFT